jgi:ABC-type nitrate/sulfonate/bicarbonate transport system substrate-binding protein
MEFDGGKFLLIHRRNFLCLAASTAVLPSMAQAQTEPINVLHLGAVGLSNIVLHLAQSRGFFAKRGVEVHLVAVTGTTIPELTDDNPVGHIGAPAAILKAARGSQLRILASLDSGQLFSHLVVHPSIKTPDDLKGKRLGARVKGAALWIHTVLALENLGLDPVKDRIGILPIGDPSIVMQALEAGEIEGAVLSGAQSKQLVAKGYSILLDLAPHHIYGATDALVATPKLMQEHPDAIEAIVFGLIDAAAFAQSSEGKTAVRDTIKRELRVASDAAADEGIAELTKIIVREPYPSLERLRNMQRVMRLADPKAGDVDVATLVDARFVRKADQEGVIDRAYAAH